MSLQEFGKNKNNYEFVQEFNRLNEYNAHLNLYNSMTGDVIQVNKGFIYGMNDDNQEE